MTILNYIELPARAGSQFTVALGDAVVTLVPRYNYSARCWCIDLLDAEGVMIAAGIMVVPNIDLLSPYPRAAATLGALVAIELNTGDHKDPDLLGLNVKFLWFAPGDEVTLPE